MATLWAVQFVQGSAMFFVLLALPTITEDLNSSIFVIIWIILGHALVSQSLTVPMSRLGDLYGKKTIFVIGLTIASVSLGLASVAADPIQLIVFRMIQGLGAGMTFGLIPAIMVDVAPKTSRGRALGIASSGIAMGGVAGPIMGGLLLTVTTWRTLFGILAVAYIAVVIASIMILPRSKSISQKIYRFDWKEGLTFSGSITAFLLGLTLSGDSNIPFEFSILMFVIALISAAIFLQMERTKEHPMLDLRLFKIRLFGGTVPIAIMVSMAVRTTPLIMVIYLQSILGLSPAVTAGVIVFMHAVQIFNVVSGWISDRIGSFIPMSFGISIYVFVFLTLSIRAPFASMPELMLYMALLGLGSLLTSPPLMSMALGSLPRDTLGVGAGILTNVRHLGNLIGQGVVITVLGFFLGQNAELGRGGSEIGSFSQSAAASGIQLVFLISMFYCLIAGFFLLLLKMRGRAKISSLDKPIGKP